MIGENYMKQIILSLKYWVNNNFALKENIPEVPVTSVNNMTGDVIIEIPESFSGKWNDLEEKPFYSDETILAHVENVEEYVHTEDGSFYFSAYFGKTELPENVSSLVGANVSATINGTQINGVLKEVTYYSDYWLSDATSVAMGNLHLLNNKSDSLVDTGEDWCISVDVGEHYPYDHAVAFTVYGRQAGSVTIESLTCFAGGNIKTLDEKFIPDTIARVSDISDLSNELRAVENKIPTTPDQVGADLKGAALEALVEAKAYTNTAIADLVNSAPETLDTLGELAEAFNENTNMVTTLEAAIVAKAEKDDLENLSDLVAMNATSIENLQKQVLPTSLILADAITGVSYTIQIQNGQLVSFETPDNHGSER